jgi:hypothetical protein
MSSEQFVGLIPVAAGIVLAWFCGSGDFWRTLRCGAFAFISLILTMQHGQLVVGMLRAGIASEIESQLLTSGVIIALLIILYVAIWQLYHQMWQPEKRLQSSKRWWLYALMGLAIGWSFSAVIVGQVVTSEAVDLGRLQLTQYVAVVEATNRFMLHQVEMFVPQHLHR